MQVLLTTLYGNLWRWNYEANKPDMYGNTNAPVIANTGDGEYCPVFFHKYN